MDPNTAVYIYWYEVQKKTPKSIKSKLAKQSNALLFASFSSGQWMQKNTETNRSLEGNPNRILNIILNFLLSIKSWEAEVPLKFYLLSVISERLGKWKCLHMYILNINYRYKIQYSTSLTQHKPHWF